MAKKKTQRWPLITLQREGQFTVNWTHSHNKQCGNVGQQILQYRVVVKGRLNKLGPNGWLMDNNDIPHYFEKRYKSVANFHSCEKIAAIACRELSQIVRSHESELESIAVSVSGIQGSLITCEWRASDETRNCPILD